MSSRAARQDPPPAPTQRPQTPAAFVQALVRSSRAPPPLPRPWPRLCRAATPRWGRGQGECAEALPHSLPARAPVSERPCRPSAGWRAAGWIASPPSAVPHRAPCCAARSLHTARLLPRPSLRPKTPLQWPVSGCNACLHVQPLRGALGALSAYEVLTRTLLCTQGGRMHRCIHTLHRQLACKRHLAAQQQC